MYLRESSSIKIDRKKSFSENHFKYSFNKNEEEIIDKVIESSCNSSLVKEKNDQCHFRDQIQIKILHLEKNKNKLNLNNESVINFEILSLFFTCSYICKCKKMLRLKSKIDHIEKKLDLNCYFKHLLDFHHIKQILFNKEQLDQLEFN